MNQREDVFNGMKTPLTHQLTFANATAPSSPNAFLPTERLIRLWLVFNASANISAPSLPTRLSHRFKLVSMRLVFKAFPRALAPTSVKLFWRSERDWTEESSAIKAAYRVSGMRGFWSRERIRIGVVRIVGRRRLKWGSVKPQFQRLLRLSQGW